MSIDLNPDSQAVRTFGWDDLARQAADVFPAAARNIDTCRPSDLTESTGSRICDEHICCSLLARLDVDLTSDSWGSCSCLTTRLNYGRDVLRAGLLVATTSGVVRWPSPEPGIDEGRSLVR